MNGVARDPQTKSTVVGRKHLYCSIACDGGE